MRVSPFHELDRLGDGRGDADYLEITLFSEKNPETLSDHGVVVDDADPNALPRDLLGARLTRRFHKSDDLTLRRRVHVFDVVKQHLIERGACPSSGASTSTTFCMVDHSPCGLRIRPRVSFLPHVVACMTQPRHST